MAQTKNNKYVFPHRIAILRKFLSRGPAQSSHLRLHRIVHEDRQEQYAQGGGSQKRTYLKTASIFKLRNRSFLMKRPKHLRSLNC